MNNVCFLFALQLFGGYTLQLRQPMFDIFIRGKRVLCLRLQATLVCETRKKIR